MMRAVCPLLKKKLIDAYQKHSKVLQNKVAKYADYVEVINGDGCCEKCYNTYEGKIFEVKEFKILPPFHPDCNCYAVFYQSEDLDYDEIQEVEL